MARKLKSAIDGFIPSQRKAFAGARIIFRKSAQMRVYQLTGKITEKLLYEHGDMSMNSCIIKMAQTFIGSNNIPPFIAISNGFGDLVEGRGITGSPRYLDIKYNARAMDILFPRIDDWLLEYSYQDGTKCEPLFYIPIMPYSILETSTTVSVGWNIKCWARDFNRVMQIIKNLIAGKFDDMSLSGHVWLPQNMRCVIGKYESSKKECEICLGKYVYNSERNVILIKQLPLKVWSYNFKCGIIGVDVKSGKSENKAGTPLAKKELAKSCIDHSANNRNHIIIKLQDNAIEEMKKYKTASMSAIENYFGLNQQMSMALNMFTEKIAIKEYASYSDILLDWFPLRKNLYILRLQRQNILLELKILFYENELRFIEMDAIKSINIDKNLNDEERIAILTEHEFQRFNKTNLFNPKYTKTDLLRQSVLEWDTSFKYIDEITIRMKSKKNIALAHKNIKDLYEELEKLRASSWQDIWLEELERLEKCVVDGMKTKWLFGEKQHIFKKANIKSRIK
jgi:DNA gyrase/topoisomerase IV subunit A